MTDVVIAGAGPTGLMLAAELRLAGAEVVLVDRLAERGSESRAGGLHPRTLEVLDQRGVVDRFLAEGREVQAGHFSALPLDFSKLDTRFGYTLLLMQADVERLLEQWVAELGVHVRWSTPVTGFRQDADGIDVETGDETIRARYLVGCDGGRSAVRKLAGIGFPGTDATMTALLADVELDDPPAEWIFGERREHGDFAVIGFGPDWYRVVVDQYDFVADRNAPVSFEEVRAAMLRVAGTDYGMRDPRWVSRFNDTARQAERYRDGRVLLAGDAAHIHFPAGGQGLNTGVQDAVNLGWKLGAVLAGTAPESLLDTYQTERYPVAERVLRNTRAQTALARPGAHTDALRAEFAELIQQDGVNAALAGMISGLDIRYPAIDPHPLAGCRVPDFDLGESTRLFSLLHQAKPIEVKLPDGDLEAVGVRPDGHVSWVRSRVASPQEAG
ncbi:FAD-dependent monooxygenase [Amycolatopsis sp. YIM 10]|uniref:FAD-dependent monooxygenase n=1 Tax=Amycolatopsis sp. YIM 10 TaxID=2653857 RepID=UPI001290336D|nr:FAD-dependent monooxygenase [Amycolatopsis sp. YIM 10]QFU93813.1 Pentachlorophenol 4-monooxygenase [Amycolatopsis sp. YIM 10]